MNTKAGPSSEAVEGGYDAVPAAAAASTGDLNFTDDRVLQRTRKIIHIDMDAFFASVEQRDNESYRGKPVIVGGAPEGRGVVAACSYEAREFGVHSAMPASRARRLCPKAIFIKPRFEAYRAASQQIQAIFKRYTELVEPLSLDEAYLDVSEVACQRSRFNGSATRVANAIRRDIFNELQLTASAGVSYNKFLAKLASDRNKPNGICVIRPGEAEALLETLPVRKFHGVGRATEQKMLRNGIHTGADLKQRSKIELHVLFGKQGLYYYNIVRGIDTRRVNNQRARKSIGAERTFAEDLHDRAAMLAALQGITGTLVTRMRAKNVSARTLTLKLRYANFEVISRSVTPGVWLAGEDTISPLLPGLLSKTEAGQRAVRLLGLSVSHLSPDSSATASIAASQLDLI